MNYETIIVQKSNGVATITLNRPERLNALTPQMAQEILEAYRAVESDPEVRVVVLTGSGRAFCAGNDVNEFKNRIDEREGQQDHKGTPSLLQGPAHSLVNSRPMALHYLLKPTIAALNGIAVGSGFSMALGCDIRIASEGARMGAIFTEMGLVPEYGSSYNLPRLVGIAKACELIFTARVIDAKEALDIGLVNQVVPADDLSRVTSEMANRIASLPPTAVQLSKRMLYSGLQNDLPSQVQLEAAGLELCTRSPEHAEAVKAFLAKRKPRPADS